MDRRHATRTSSTYRNFRIGLLSYFGEVFGEVRQCLTGGGMGGGMFPLRGALP